MRKTTTWASALAATAALTFGTIVAAPAAQAVPCSQARESGWVNGKAQSYTQSITFGCSTLGAAHTFRVPSGGSTVYTTAWRYSTGHVAYSPTSASPYTLVKALGTGW